MKTNELFPCEIQSGDTPPPATYWIGDEDEYIAAFRFASDAVTVCRIVNGHADLLAACKAALHRMVEDGYEACGPNAVGATVPGMLRAVIARAEREAK